MTLYISNNKSKKKKYHQYLKDYVHAYIFLEKKV